MEKRIIHFEQSNIKHETDKAYLIKLPGIQDKFWLAKQHVEQETHWFYKGFLFEGFEYNINKYGNGKNTKNTIIHQYTYTAAELADKFND